MQKVITINLNGNAYQIDEDGYAALVAYLEGAGRSLKDNPDLAEIIADLEQAIADKCRSFLGPHKTVVTAAEVDQIIREMGPVDGSGGADPQSATGDDARSAGASAAGAGTGAGRAAPRRLYLIHEGAMLAGVCNGLAAYLNLDVTLVRIAFLLLALVTRGGFGLAYLALAFVIPPADTSEERAAAHGQPFNAQELIDRAKQKYASFADSQGWHRRWRREQRAWRRKWRASGWHPYSGWSGGWGTPPSPPPGAYGLSMLAGLRAALLTVVFTLLLWFWAWTIFSLVMRGHVFGQTLPDNVPPWMGIVALVVLFQFVAWPLRFARRRAYYYAPGAAHYYYAPLAVGGVISLGFWVLAAWLAYNYIPEVREIIRALPDVWNSFVRSIDA
jgi:phage shock protein PspC (stress-responsive transcriptional regulator)